MLYKITPDRPGWKKILLAFSLFYTVQAGFSQISITGPTCVEAGIQYNYMISGSWTTSTNMSWTVTGGTISGAASGTPMPQAHVTWTSGTGRSIQLSTSNPNGSASLNISVSSALSVGTISNPVQNINSGTNPATITCTAATGGGCGSDTYAYQWQQSTNALDYTDISGATSQNLSFTAGLTQTTYYKRMVTVSGSGTTDYTDPASVYVYPPLVPGSISPSAQNINYGSGTTLQSTGVSGGTGTYTYRWLSSSAPTGFGVIAGATGATYSPTNLTATTYYQVEVSSGGALDYSSIASVTVYPQLVVSAITPVSQYVLYNSNAASISVSASGGNGSYSYQWQTSPDGSTWTDIPGANAASYAATNLTASAYFKVIVTSNGASVSSGTASASMNTTDNMNYIRVREFQKPGVTDLTTANSLTDAADVMQSTQYFDGLGRLIQTVAKKATPNQFDLVAPTVYDAFGREATKYMPYVSSSNDGFYKLDGLTEQNSFNAGQFPTEQYYYGKVDYEASPLNRVQKTYAPGQNWVGASRGVSQQYLLNEASDSVRIWTIASAPGSIPTTTAMYDAGTLYKNQTTDEQNHSVVEYKDLQGKVILKKVQLADSPGSAHMGWLCTYYIYDDLDNLRFVIQPKAIDLLEYNATWDLSSVANLTNELCFRYEYDARKRMIIKKVPGAGEVWMVYDARDRLVMTQDSLQRAANKWVTHEYDSLNREWRTTLLSDTHSRTYHQNLAYNSISYPNLSGATYDFEKQYFYDDYSWVYSPLSNVIISSSLSNPNYFFTSFNSSPEYAQSVTPDYQTRGKLTGQKVGMLLTGAGSGAVSSVFFYDDHSRLIQRISTNFTNGRDVVTNQYDFSGRMLRSLLNQQKGGANSQNHVAVTKMSYDAQGRLTTIKKNLDNATADQLIATNSYNELGQLQKKYLGNNIDSLAYEYNIRGWLSTINKDYISGTSSANYFGMELGYDKTASAAGTTSYTAAQYNGNIAGTVWKTAGDGIGRKYDFTYDNVNRLTSAAFLQNTSGSGWDNSNIDFSVGNLAYDANGNILSMNQNGFKVGGSSPIDQLTYSYQTNSNKLQQVTDGGNDKDSKLGDFHYDPATKTSTDYSYDGSGNLTQDKNKGISSIVYYPYNGLPKTITITGKGSIAYAYDADGNKLAKKVVDNTASPAKTNLTVYVEGFQYLNDTLQSIAQEEGRIRWAFHKYTTGTTANGFEYDFFEKDHLGNTRVVLTQQKDTAQYRASMEAAYRNTESKLFSNIENTSYAVNQIPGTYPADNTTNPNDSVARVNGSGQKLGPYIVLKVMAGDTISIGVKSYYVSQGTTTTSSSFTDVLASFASGIVNISGVGKGTMAELGSTSGPLDGALTSFITDHNASQPPGLPKAYLNWISLDEQLKYVSSGDQSGAVPVGNFSSGILGTPGVTGIVVAKSGYMYIYVNNESENWDVFFDNLSVEHKSGPLLEETHYYPFGLEIAGLSTKALKPYYAENRYKFNGGNELQSKEFSDGSGLELYDAVHRMYDPQIGRFGQIDPYADVFSGWSPYSFANNDPTLLNDPYGLLSDSAHPQKLETVVFTSKVHKSSTSIIDSRPSKANPDFKFGTNTPFYVHYNQTDPGQWNPQITTEFATSLKISAALIPAGKGLKLTYEAYKLLQRLRSLKNIPEAAKKADENTTPDYPLDPTKPPAEGWVWRGQPGSTPGSGQGSWYNPGTRESLHPDLDHPDPIGPHWDYKSSGGQTYRLFPNGRIEPK